MVSNIKWWSTFILIVLALIGNINNLYSQSRHGSIKGLVLNIENKGSAE